MHILAYAAGTVDLIAAAAAYASSTKTQMMTKVMAWAPYIWGRNVVITAPTVTRYMIDVATTSISLRQIAVSNHVKAGS
ncbi:MAG TPA: hypothetical protein VGO31_16205 [Microbacteriaceae bacterium]|jgi:hypothetical protein|nr:hypothetical protein [Microbacteriaceae bacterium]